MTRLPLALIVSFAALGPVAVADQAPAPTVKMAPFRVYENIVANFEFKIRYKQSGYVGAYVDGVWVRSVKENSVAAKAGMVPGMEILAIQGTNVRGLKQEEFGGLLGLDASKGLVLTVRRSDKAEPYDIHFSFPGH